MDYPCSFAGKLVVSHFDCCSSVFSISFVRKLLLSFYQCLILRCFCAFLGHGEARLFIKSSCFLQKSLGRAPALTGRELKARWAAVRNDGGREEVLCPAFPAQGCSRFTGVGSQGGPTAAQTRRQKFSPGLGRKADRSSLILFCSYLR